MSDKITFQNVKGTMDFYPSEFAVQDAVFSSLKKTAESFGFLQVEPPVFEYTDLLVAKSGEEIKNQLFNLEKKSTEELSLRPELTPGITRMFIEKQKNTPKPVKWFGLNRMWRYEAPQKGRMREFFQISVELFGSDTPEADTEIITLATQCLLNLGLTEKDFIVKINNRKLLQGFIQGLGVKNFEDVTRIIDKKYKIDDVDFTAELKKLKLNTEQVSLIKEFTEIKKLDDALKFKLNEVALSGLQELKTVFEIFPYNVLKFDPAIARGLAYYTGTVFEIYDAKGKFRAIAGGGRYDNLVEILGGMPTPATGFGMGNVTLGLLLQDKGLTPVVDSSVDYFIATVDDNVKKNALEIALKLRKKFKVDFNIMERNLGKQFSYANSINAKHVIIVGEEEVKRQSVKVKDMKTGKEEIVKIKDLVN